jgi:hypothetical protein
MTRYFDIAVSPSAFSVAPGQHADITMSITNLTASARRCGVRFSCNDVDFDVGLITLEHVSTDITAASATANMQFVIDLPAGATPGAFEVVPTVYDADAPDEIFTAGGIIAINVESSKATIERYNRTEKRYAIVIVIAAVAIIAGLALALQHPIREQLHLSRMVALLDDDAERSGQRVPSGFWGDDAAFSGFIQRLYDRSSNATTWQMTRAVKRYITTVERGRLIGALGNIVKANGQAAYSDADVLSAFARTYGVDKSLYAARKVDDQARYDADLLQYSSDSLVYGADTFEVAGGGDVSSSEDSLGKAELAKLVDGDDATGIAVSTKRASPWCRVDLNCDRMISRIVLCDQAHDKARKGLDAFVLSILDSDKREVWRFKRESEGSDAFAVTVPNVTGRYIQYAVDGTSYFSLSEIRAYSTNMAFDTQKGQLIGATDGDNATFAPISARGSISITLPKGVVVDRIRLRVSAGSSDAGGNEGLFSLCRKFADADAKNPVDKAAGNPTIDVATLKNLSDDAISRALQGPIWQAFLMENYLQRPRDYFVGNLPTLQKNYSAFLGKVFEDFLTDVSRKASPGSSQLPASVAILVNGIRTIFIQTPFVRVSGGGVTWREDLSKDVTVEIDAHRMKMDSIVIGADNSPLNLYEVEVYGAADRGDTYLSPDRISSRLSSYYHDDPNNKNNDMDRVKHSSRYALLSSVKQTPKDYGSRTLPQPGEFWEGHFAEPVSLIGVAMSTDSSKDLPQLKGISVKGYDLSGTLVATPIENKDVSRNALDCSFAPTVPVSFVRVYSSSKDGLALSSLGFRVKGGGKKLPLFARFSSTAGVSGPSDAGYESFREYAGNAPEYIGKASEGPPASIRFTLEKVSKVRQIRIFASLDTEKAKVVELPAPAALPADSASFPLTVDFLDDNLSVVKSLSINMKGRYGSASLQIAPTCRIIKLSAPSSASVLHVQELLVEAMSQ